MKPLDGCSDRLRGSSGAVFGFAAMLSLEFDEFFQFTEGFGFDGFGLGIVVEDGFEFFLFFVEAAHGFAVIKGEAAFLQTCTAQQRSRFAGGGVGEGGEAEVVAIEFGDFGDEIQSVDRLVWVGEEIGDVKHAALVANVGFLAFEGEVPEPVPFAQGKPGSVFGCGWTELRGPGVEASEDFRWGAERAQVALIVEGQERFEVK